jgi:hypothetical protein
MEMRQGLVRASLEKFAKGVVEQAKANLARENKNVTGNLSNSLQYEIEVGPNSLALRWKMDELAPYWKFQDYGVKGKTSSNKAPNSPFRFGTGSSGMRGGLTRAINQWVRTRRFQFQSREEGKKGQFLSYDATAFLITRSIYNKGIKTTSFFTNPFKLEFKQLPAEIAQAYALEVADFLRFTLQPKPQK